jgi:LPXTG-site transpeptidase (sortase) family protein
VLTRSRPTSGRGDLTLTVSALGLALLLGGGAAVARVTAADPSPDPAVGPSSTAGDALPYVMEPPVRLERAAPAEAPSTAAGQPRAHRARGVPTGVVVPRLGVDVPVVGIDAPGGVLTPPSDPRVLGWWRSGAEAGSARGSALVTGHTVNAGGGALDDLEKMRRGDPVRVRTTAGVIDYVVTGVSVYRKAAIAEDAARIFSQSVPGRLALITCEDWDGTAYLSNVVVIAEPRRSR